MKSGVYTSPSARVPDDGTTFGGEPALPKVPTPREELVEIQREIFQRNYERLLESEIDSPGQLKRYEATYNLGVQRYSELSTIDELARRARKADLVYVGDYHTLGVSQKTFVKLLRRLRRPNKKLLIGLEFVEGRYQEEVDRYLAGRIKDTTFLKRIRYAERWPYDIWPNFKLIFEFAQKYEIPIRALDCDSRECNTLHGRDSYAGWRIAEAFSREPDAQMVVLFGELHIAPEHLPTVVAENLAKLGETREWFIVYQNCEEIYWSLVEKGLEQTEEVVEIDERRFCILNTPPIIVQQSYLNWLDYDEDSLEHDNLLKNFNELIDVLIKFLRLSSDTLQQAREELQVYGPGDTRFMRKLRKRHVYSEHHLEILRQQILEGESFFLPEANLVYLGNLSVNHAGEEATHFLKTVLSGYEGVQPMRDAFYTRIMHEAIGFFGSKIINHKRKSPNERYFRQIVRNFAHDPTIGRDELTVAVCVLMHKRWEQGKNVRNFSKLFHQDDAIFNMVTHSLGYMLGDKLYYALLEGTITKGEIVDLFHESFEETNSACATYFHLCQIVANTKTPKRL
ncbi:MAG: ChaN family lipoprotein [Myxococcales bacterium]|nr:ChaN family lipoprotein [Myxococcales bacterium]